MQKPHRTTVTDENQMTDEELDVFLAQKLVARLGTVSKDGSAHVTPVWYLWRDGVAYFIFGKDRVHVKNMRRDPRATLCVDVDPRLTEGFTAGAMGAEIKGTMELTTDPSVRDFVYPEIAELYDVADSPEYIAARDAEERLLGIFRPTRVVTWDFTKG